MGTHVAISVLGKDRPGIVKSISRALYETGCNIEDSSMTSLRSEFAMILLVALPSRLTLKNLEARLNAAGRASGLSIFVRPLKAEEKKKAKKLGHPHLISVYGADKPGIVYRISELLSENGVNITDVQTSISGKGKNIVYVMLLEADLPPRVTPGRLLSKLEALAKALSITVTMHPVDEVQL